VALAGTLTGVGGASTVGAGFIGATHAMWFVILGFAAVIFVLAFLANSQLAKRSTQRIADLLSDDPAPRSNDRSSAGTGSTDAQGVAATRPR
jgi:hypothetical protein